MAADRSTVAGAVGRDFGGLVYGCWWGGVRFRRTRVRVRSSRMLVSFSYPLSIIYMNV